MTARIIILNGTSSVGKTTLFAMLQPLLPDTFCYYASDQLADEGFRPTAAVARLDGRETFFDRFHRSIASFASAGLDMLVEHINERRPGALTWVDCCCLLKCFGSYDFSTHTTQPANAIAAQVAQAWHSRATLPS